MTRDAWLSAHPYLQRVAELCAEVEAAASGIATAPPGTPRWDDYAPDFGAGVPLLQSSEAALDLEPAGLLIGALVEGLAAGRPAGRLAEETRTLDAELRRDGASQRVVDWLLREDALAPSSPGLLRFLGWSALARWLQPVVHAFDRWRDEERWQRNYCPTCGAPPAMAQLVGTDPGRLRLLSCGCCKTRWRFNRTRCPFCDSDVQRLLVVAVEGEAGLRIDYCEACRGYLKTYVGEEDEDLLLADWSSLHLDLVAGDRGLKRLAGSLYELDASVA